MSPAEYLITMNFNRIELNSWIEKRLLPDGNYDLIGMGRRREYDANSGALIFDKIEPTGLTGWAPAGAFGEFTSSWWERLFLAIGARK